MKFLFLFVKSKSKVYIGIVSCLTVSSVLQSSLDEVYYMLFFEHQVNLYTLL